jgi:hypothetical protein
MFQDRKRLPDPSAKDRSLLDPLGAIRPFNRVVGPNQAFSIIGRSATHRDVARQFALGKLVAVNLKVQLGGRLGNCGRAALPFAWSRLGLTPVGTFEIWGARLSQRWSRKSERRDGRNKPNLNLGGA